MEKTIAKYTIRITRGDSQDDSDWYFAHISDGKNRYSTSTQTLSKEELWDMIGDAILTVEDVEISWWNRLLHELHIY